MSETARRFTASDGVELAYWLVETPSPSASAILLLHGAASNHTRWSEFVEKTSLGNRWHLLRPDLRGNGESMTRGRLSLDVWCRDLEETIAAEGYQRVLVIGHSLGAQIAVHLAKRMPQVTAGLALIDPVFPHALTGRRRAFTRVSWLVRWLAFKIRILNALGIRRRDIPNRDLRQLDEETRKALQDGKPHEVIAKRYSALGLILRHMPTANYLQQLIEAVAPLPPPEEIHVPVLVLLSAGITFADPDINRREIARFPQVEVVEIDANHWPLTEKPDDVRRAIEGWVEKELENA